MSESIYEIGDVVRISNSFPHKREIRGEIGVIREVIWGSTCGVEILTTTFDGGHDCGGRTQKGCGYYINSPELSRIPKIDCLFQPGDRVRCIKEYDYKHNVVGKEGTVVRADGMSVGVRFDKNIGGHDLGGLLKGGYSGHGWNFPESCLELINEKKAGDSREESESATQDEEYPDEQTVEVELCVDSKKQEDTFAEYIKKIPTPYIFVARDTDGSLFAYIEEPCVDIGGKQYYGERFKKIDDSLFPSLNFMDGAKKIRG